MNEIPREEPLDHVIDRIVDGSLGPGELRVALSRLEPERDGWKQLHAGVRGSPVLARFLSSPRGACRFGAWMRTRRDPIGAAETRSTPYPLLA